MNKTRSKLPKPSKINRKLTLSKEMLAQLTGGAELGIRRIPALTEAIKFTDYEYCLAYTC